MVNEESKDLKNEEKKEPDYSVPLTKKQQEEILKAFEEAKQPIVLTDGKFQLGEREVSIMSLSKKYREQILFRMLCHEVSYSRTIHQDLVDVMKLVMILLKKLGIQDIVKATEDLEDELAEKIKSAE